MRDYLQQLTLRVQQPEFAVQPRPVSRFESPPHLIREPSDLSAPGEPSEPELQSEHVISTETSAVQPRQQTESIHRNEHKIVEPTSEARLTKVAHKPYPAGQLPTEPSNVSHLSRMEVAHHPVQERAHPAIHGRFTKQNEPIARREKEAIEPAVRIEKPTRAVGMTSSNLGRGGETSKLATRVVQGERKKIYLPVKIAEQTRPLSRPVSNPSSPQEQAELTEPRFHQKTHLMPMPDFASRSGREQFKSFAENRAPQFAAERGTEMPTIQVTIGRVEIRATVASTPTRKPPAKSSAMSLDEYLTRRTEGRR